MPIIPEANLYKDVYTKEPITDVRADDYEFSDYIEFLKELHKMKHSNKSDNALIAQAIFNPISNPITEKYRTLKNVAHVDSIWLDNDGGELTYEEFAAICPWQMYIFNTYSSGKGKVRKWRVFIPVVRSHTREEHDGAIRLIKKLLSKNGYDGSTKRHGFDTTKFSASSLFYLPCQSKYGDSFFKEYTNNREVFNYDHEEIPEEIKPYYLNDFPKNNLRNNLQLEDARERYIQRPRGEQHVGLWAYSQRLWDNSVPTQEAYTMLLTAAQQSHNPSERITQVHKQIMPKYGMKHDG